MHDQFCLTRKSFWLADNHCDGDRWWHRWDQRILECIEEVTGWVVGYHPVESSVAALMFESRLCPQHLGKSHSAGKSQSTSGGSCYTDAGSNRRSEHNHLRTRGLGIFSCTRCSEHRLLCVALISFSLTSAWRRCVVTSLDGNWCMLLQHDWWIRPGAE